VSKFIFEATRFKRSSEKGNGLAVSFFRRPFKKDGGRFGQTPSV